MKILIVDDELLVRIGLKSSIDWERHGIEIVGEASNGREAFEKIEKCKPDVLLLDIKMPVMDGIELLQKLKESKYTCKTVILSSFDDLEHVKEAMKLGAVDYLHKPCMSPEGILSVLTNIKNDLEKADKKPVSGVVPEENKGVYNDLSSFLRKLVDGQIANESEFQEGCREFKVGLGRSNYSCMAFSVINFSKVEQRYTDDNRNLLSKSILDILSQVFLNEKEIVFFQYGRNLYLSVMSMEKIPSDKKIFELQNRNVHLISDSLKKFLDIEVGIGISGTHPSYKGVKTAFSQAFKALHQRFYSPSEKTIFYSTLHIPQDSKGLLSRINNSILKIKECISNQNYYQFGNIIEEVFGLLRQNPSLSADEVTKLFNGVLFLLNELDTCFEEMELISGCETLEELHDLFEQIVNRKLYNCMKEDEYRNCSFIVKKILAYVNSHYAEEISLTVLSDHLNVSPNYISRIFKEELGKTLFNYINEVRVEQAKRLMHQQELKIYEIGEKVGFNSSVHFNIVFNKLTGYSPKQYRDTMIN